MSGSGASVATMLCDLIDMLRKQHRGGITPSFGQIEDLFEFSDRLRATVAASAMPAEEARPSACGICGRPDQLSATVILGKRLCREHQRSLTELVRYLATAVPGALPQQSRVDWPSGEPELAGAGR